MAGEPERMGLFMGMAGRIALVFVIFTVLLRCEPSKNDALPAKADRILSKILTLDSHVDTPMRVFERPTDLSIRHQHSEKDAGELDFPRMKDGGLDAAFFAVYVRQAACNEKGRADAKMQAEKMIDLVLDWRKQYPSLVEVAFAPEDADRIRGTGRRIAYIGMENGYPLGTDPALVMHFFERGVRYITLCHVRNNDICDSSSEPDGSKWSGLSPFGRTAVREMNRVGMLIDLSHASDSTFYQTLRISKTPVILSHSCCRALMDSHRNLTDDMLVALKRNGGVIQINLCSFYLIEAKPYRERQEALNALKKKYGEWSKISDLEKQREYDEVRAAIDRRFPEEKASVADLVNHIDHVVRVAGIDRVGIGSDFDGGAGLSDCEDVSRMRNITIELVRRGYSERDIAKIWSGNFMRVWKEVLRKAGE
jgi:membrane dipeptidase